MGRGRLEAGGSESRGQAQRGWTVSIGDIPNGIRLKSRKVGQVVFHPTASNLLTSASGDHLVRLWDIEHGQDAPQITLKGHGDSIQSIAWNPVGNQLATVCPPP